MGDEKWVPSSKELKSVEYLASLGFTEKQLAMSLAISESTLQRGFIKYDALREAVSKGRTKACEQLSTRAWEMAQQDPGMMKFWLSCKFGWARPPQQVQVSGPDGGAIVTAQETEEEKKLRVDAAIARIKQSLSK